MKVTELKIGDWVSFAVKNILISILAIVMEALLVVLVFPLLLVAKGLLIAMCISLNRTKDMPKWIDTMFDRTGCFYKEYLSF